MRGQSAMTVFLLKAKSMPLSCAGIHKEEREAATGKKKHANLGIARVVNEL